jgi:hypothetical protein
VTYFCPEDGGSKFLQNTGNNLQHCMVSEPRKSGSKHEILCALLYSWSTVSLLKTDLIFSHGCFHCTPMEASHRRVESVQHSSNPRVGKLWSMDWM